MRLFWQLIDKYVQKSLGKKECYTPQYKFSKKVYFKIPNKTQTNIKNKILKEDSQYEYGEIKYKSLINNETCNDNIVIKYQKNKYNKNAKNFIFIHGWKANSFKKLDDIMFSYLTKKGYNIYYYTLPFHMYRKKSNAKFSGEYYLTANIDRTINSFSQAVSDLKILIKYIKNKYSGKIITVGLSLGCITNNLLVSHEKNIDASISLFYPNSLSYLIFNVPVEKRLNIELLENNISENDLNLAWDSIIPSNYKPLVPKEKLFFIAGKYDELVPYKNAKLLWEKWDKPKQVLLNCGHSGVVLSKNKIKEHVFTFINSL